MTFSQNIFHISHSSLKMHSVLCAWNLSLYFYKVNNDECIFPVDRAQHMVEGWDMYSQAYDNVWYVFEPEEKKYIYFKV